MKKIAITLFALAAVSTAALANSNRSYDLRESPEYTGVNALQPFYVTKSVSAMSMGSSSAPTAAELLIRNQEKNELSGH